MISVILPSRKRVEAFKKSIYSLIENARIKDSFEVLAIFDNDDVESKEAAEKEFPGIKTFIFPHVGYEFLHEYYNRLVPESVGDWIFLWNDDAVMITPGWDEIILSIDKFCCIGSMNVNASGGMYQAEILFPIFPRKYFDILGHVSLNRHTDSWIYYIFNELELIVPSKIQIFHDRPDLGGGNDDEVYKSRKYDVESLVTVETMLQKNADLEKISEYAKYENSRKNVYN